MDKNLTFDNFRHLWFNFYLVGSLTEVLTPDIYGAHCFNNSSFSHTRIIHNPFSTQICIYFKRGGGGGGAIEEEVLRDKIEDLLYLFCMPTSLDLALDVHIIIDIKYYIFCCICNKYYIYTENTKL